MQKVYMLKEKSIYVKAKSKSKAKSIYAKVLNLQVVCFYMIKVRSIETL